MRRAALLLILATACKSEATTPPGSLDGPDASVPGTTAVDSGGTRPPPGPDPRCLGPQPGVAPVRLLTRTEYDNTVRDLLHDSTSPARALPPENHALGFDNNAEAHLVSPHLTEKYIDVAEAVAARAVQDKLTQILPCDPASDGEVACGRQFVSVFGRLAFRRPLEPAEVALFVDLFETVLAGENFVLAIESVIAATLQSPQFLYRIETLTSADAEGAVIPLRPFEMASRLSYFLWKTMPDEALLRAAADDRLATADQVADQARRMLADPKARDTVADFHRQWLEIDAVGVLVKDLERDDLGGGIEHLRASWIASLDAFVSYAFFDAADPLGALFGSPLVFVDGETAPVYGAQVSGSGLTSVELPNRAGLLTQPALMAKLAHPDQTSPIHRGIFVREKLMCQALPPPPPDVVIEAPSPDPTATTRERFAQHTADPACQGCHVMIDPIGFGFESYDELGRFRTVENGKPVDTTGEVFGAIEYTVNGPFSGAVELASKLASSSQVQSCVSKQWYRYAFGRGESASVADECTVAEVQAVLAAANGDLKALLVAITASDVFRLRTGTAIVVASPLPADPDAGVSMDAEPPPPPTDAGPTQIGSPVRPIGNFDSIDMNGRVTGWTIDPNTPSYPLYIEFFVDGPPGQGARVLGTRADQPRADVNQATGHPGDHGFVQDLPGHLFDGMDHQLWVVAFNTGSGGNTTLSGSPMTFNIGTLNRPPIGFIDSVSAQGVAGGWTLDPDDANRSIDVHFYVDGPAGSGTFIGAITASTPRPDVNQVTGHPGDHGFNFTLPMSVRNGARRQLFVYAIDATGGRNPQLTNSPMMFQVGP